MSNKAIDKLAKRIAELLKGEEVTVVVPALAELMVAWCSQDSDLDYVTEVMEAAIDQIVKPEHTGERLH